MPSQVQPRIFIRKSGLSPYTPRRRSSLRQSVSAQHNTDHESSDEDWSPGLANGQRKRKSPPSPVLGHTSPVGKRLAFKANTQASVPGLERSSSDRASSCATGSLSVSGIYSVMNLPATENEASANRPQASTVPSAGTSPIPASPVVAALEAEIKDLKVQLLRVKFDELFRVKNRLVQCMQKIEEAEDANKKLKEAHDKSHISWHIIQTVFPQITSLLDSDNAIVRDIYDRAHQAQLVLDESSKTTACGERNENIGVDPRLDQQTSRPSQDVQTPLSDDIEEHLISRIQGALLGTPSSSPIPISATGHACSTTPSHFRHQSSEKKIPRILPGTIQLPAYLTSHLTTDSRTPDTSTPASSELAATESDRPRLTPFSQIDSQQPAIKLSPNSPGTSVAEFIAHIRSLPEKIIDPLTSQYIPATATGPTIPDSTENTPASSPVPSSERALHSFSTPKGSRIIHKRGEFRTNEKETPAVRDETDAIMTEADALRAELWRLREHNRKLERRVRVLLNQQSGCGF